MNPPLLVIGNRNYSSWSLRPWLLLRHFGMDFTEERIALDQPDTAARIRRHSPTGRVPVLVDGPLAVWDSLAICEYANERWLDGAGWPADRAARAVARSIAAEMHSGFPALRRELPMNVRARGRRVTPSESARADIERVDLLLADVRRRFGSEGPWRFGAFGIADAMYAPVASRFATYGIPTGELAEAWCAAVLDHPAMREWARVASGEAEIIDADEAG